MESSPDPLTKEAAFFLEPASASHRQYEALRAYFVEGISSQLVAERFSYTAGSFRVLCHHFRRSQPEFFRDLKPGPRSQPKKDAVRDLILAMRKQNLSVYDIRDELERSHHSMTQAARALGLERSHLYKKCAQLGIDVKSMRRAED